MKKLNLLLMGVVLLAGLLTGACKSDDEKDINDILPGTWVLDKSVNPKGYEIEPNDGTEIMIDHLEMKADKTFSLVYDEYDSDSGTYEAGNAYIRFNYADVNKQEEVFLWQVFSFTDNTLHAKYKDTDRDLTVTVWLKKR